MRVKCRKIFNMNIMFDQFKIFLNNLNLGKIVIGLLLGKVLTDVAETLLDEFLSPIVNHYLIKDDEHKIPYFYGNEINITKIINKIIIAMFTFLTIFLVFKNVTKIQ